MHLPCLKLSFYTRYLRLLLLLLLCTCVTVQVDVRALKDLLWDSLVTANSLSSLSKNFLSHNTAASPLPVLLLRICCAG